MGINVMDKYGLLTVQQVKVYPLSGNVYLACTCECGNWITLFAPFVVDGTIKSCDECIVKIAFEETQCDQDTLMPEATLTLGVRNVETQKTPITHMHL